MFSIFRPIQIKIYTFINLEQNNIGEERRQKVTREGGVVTWTKCQLNIYLTDLYLKGIEILI